MALGTVGAGSGANHPPAPASTRRDRKRGVDLATSNVGKGASGGVASSPCPWRLRLAGGNRGRPHPASGYPAMGRQARGAGGLVRR